MDFHLSMRLIGSRFLKQLFEVAIMVFIHQYDSVLASGKEFRFFLYVDFILKYLIL